jgi:hypothetical protein
VLNATSMVAFDKEEEESDEEKGNNIIDTNAPS